MIVDSVKLRNFRNYENAFVQLNPNINLITGDNAQGKTNFLEALVYLSLTRSHRIRDDAGLIRNGESAADISCIFNDNGMQKEIEAVIYQKGKTLKLHHQPVKKASEFIGLLNTVLFSPDDLTIFQDSPGRRRRIMNQEISKISPKYLHALNHYQSLLKERNLLLKQDRINMVLLDSFDEEMSQDESIITAMRKDFVDEINRYLSKFYKQISGNSSMELKAEYACAYTDFDADKIMAKHHDVRDKDQVYHTTTCGIHREDILFEMNDQNITEFASQGQKRMAVLSFKMCLLHYIEDKIGKKPVLLLDDVLSELDETRQRMLINMVEGPYQCIITTTDIPSYLQNKNMSVFHVNNGIIEKVEGTV